ncbi:EF-hand domain-containing protein, partial [bacterium]|nr:EF-hand domain-containing protein [bacterium]
GILNESERTAFRQSSLDRIQERMNSNTEFKDRIMGKLDANNDGTISVDELGSKRKGRKGKGDMFSNFDTDGDGVISDAEKEASKTAIYEKIQARMDANPEMKAKFLEKFDADGDGNISSDEFSGNHTSKMGNRGNKKQENMSNFDTDGDGVISDAEKEAAKSSRLERMQQKMEENPEMKAKILDRFDSNGDGVLGSDEITSGKKGGRGGMSGSGGMKGSGGGGRRGRW